MHERVQRREQTAQHPLMPDRRRRAHVVLAAQQLVAFPVVGERHEVGVGELDGSLQHGHTSIDGDRALPEHAAAGEEGTGRR